GLDCFVASLLAMTTAGLLPRLHKAHAHPGRRCGGFAGEPLSAGPGAKTLVVFVRPRALHIAMRAPAVLIFGSGKLGAAALLRPAGKAFREIRRLAVAERGEDIAAAHLIAEEMRRGRHHRRVRWFCRHPVDTGEMKTADAARLVAAGAGDVVEAARKARDRADVLQGDAVLCGLLQRVHDIVLGEDGFAALARNEAV